MSRVVHSRIRALVGYEPGEQPPTDSQWIKLNTNENPYPASPEVTRAVNDAAARLHLYPEPSADGIRRRAAEYYGLAPDNVLVGNGSDEILSLCFKACTRPGDRVAYPVPTYSLYRTLAEIADCEAVEAVSRDGDVPAEIRAANARITFLCTPNSPLGYEIDSAQVRSIAESTAGLVVVDEAYVDFGGTSAIPLVAECDNVVVVRTLSKSFSLAGARIGLAFAQRGLISELCKVKDSYNVSRLAQAAGEAALGDIEWMLVNVARIRGTRERVRSELLRLGVEVPPSSANFLWLECGERGGESVYRALRESGVLARFFDVPILRSGIRVTIGTDQQMDRFLDVMSSIVKENRRML